MKYRGQREGAGLSLFHHGTAALHGVSPARHVRAPLVWLAWTGLLSFFRGLVFFLPSSPGRTGFPPAAKTSSQGALEFLNLENNSL